MADNTRMRSGGPEGPTTHYLLFAGLHDAGIDYLVAGATALTLHGVPRLTTAIDLIVDPDPANLERQARLFGAWGYAVAAGAAADARRSFRHPSAALDRVDCVPAAPGEFPRLRSRAARASLVDVDIPFLGADDLRTLRERDGAAGREDADALTALAAVRAGDAGAGEDTRREQIRKFSRWSIAARCDWLLAAARLDKGLSPEARPMTRGLVRRRGWYGR